MKTLAKILPCLALISAGLTSCEPNTTVVNPPSGDGKKVEHNTTIVTPAKEEKKVENNTTIVNPPAAKEEKKVEKTTTTTETKQP